MVTVNVRHNFSHEELLQKSTQIANLINDINTEEAEKKAVGAEYKNKIDKLKAEAKLVSGHITNGFMYTDKPAELWLDYETHERVFTDKHDGTVLKREPFHASDFQKKIDFDEEERNRQLQIDENNEAGEAANGNIHYDFTNIDQLNKVISDKKASKTKKEKPKPSDNLGEHYGKGFEVAE